MHWSGTRFIMGLFQQYVIEKRNCFAVQEIKPLVHIRGPKMIYAATKIFMEVIEINFQCFNQVTEYIFKIFCA